VAALSAPSCRCARRRLASRRGLAAVSEGAVLLALQTHVHIERDAEGRWQILVDKPTTSEELLKPIVQRLLAMPAEPAGLPK
jgi:hypothetical protein